MVYCRLLLVISLLFSASAGVRAEFSVPDATIAFVPSMAPGTRAIELKACEAIKDAGPGNFARRFDCERGRSVDSRQFQRGAKKSPFELTLTRSSGEAKFQIAVEGAALGWLESVHQLDINKDGELDYIMEYSARASGINELKRTLIFFISQGNGFRYHYIPNLVAPAMRHFGSLQGRFVFMTSRLSTDAATGLKANDGKQYLFLIFDLLSLEPNESEFKEEKGGTFPVWKHFASRADGPQDKVMLSTRDQLMARIPPLVASKTGQVRAVR
jgi:hypothetical protein